MQGPMFASFEGVDGSGKTTQVGMLDDHLRRQGRTVKVFREPGGTELGERVRDLVLGKHEVVPWAEVSLFAAARAQLVETEIRPALAAGCDVICDRYLDSSVAYQGSARGLGAEAVLDWNLRVTGGLLPDVTFFLQVPVEDASARISQSSGLTSPGKRGEPDRLELESLAFHESVERGYLELAHRYPERIVVIDGKLSQETISSRIKDVVDALLCGERSPR